MPWIDPESPEVGDYLLGRALRKALSVSWHLGHTHPRGTWLAGYVTLNRLGDDFSKVVWLALGERNTAELQRLFPNLRSDWERLLAEEQDATDASLLHRTA